MIPYSILLHDIGCQMALNYLVAEMQSAQPIHKLFTVGVLL